MINGLVFCEGSFVFRSVFSAAALLSIALMASATEPARPRVVPSEDHSHGGGLGLPLFHEGRRTEDAQQSRKKKTMKTTSQKKQVGLGARSAQSSSTDNSTEAKAPETQRQDTRLPIDSEARKKNRTLPTDKVLQMLQTASPELFHLAEVVGKWVWVTFQQQPAAELRQQLAQLGFHWNRERQAWQHPCGAFRLGSSSDPRERYTSHRPAHQKPA